MALQRTINGSIMSDIWVESLLWNEEHWTPGCAYEAAEYIKQLTGYFERIRLTGEKQAKGQKGGAKTQIVNLHSEWSKWGEEREEYGGARASKPREGGSRVNPGKHK